MLEDTADNTPTYLQPYERAARSHGAGFGSLLWASERTQAIRFDALRRAVDFHGRLVCDAGCGRADLLDHLLAHGVVPAEYVGIEAVDALAAAAERKQRPGKPAPAGASGAAVAGAPIVAPAEPRVRILRGDFIRQPVRLFVGAEVVAFSGSLNTVEDAAFYQTLRRAFDATAWALVFNFLSSRELAGGSHLHWRSRGDVERFVSTLGAKEMRGLDDYLDGDCTLVVLKDDPHAS
jgi:hypothetical protein